MVATKLKSGDGQAHRLTRRGVAVVSVVVGAALAGAASLAVFVQVERQQQIETSQLRQQIDQLRAKAATPRPDVFIPESPQAQLEGLRERLTRLEGQTKELMVANGAALVAAKLVPELKSPQYRDPFEALMLHLLEGDVISQQIQADRKVAL